MCVCDWAQYLYLSFFLETQAISISETVGHLVVNFAPPSVQGLVEVDEPIMTGFMGSRDQHKKEDIDY
jgi:hypothetical protein